MINRKKNPTNASPEEDSKTKEKNRLCRTQHEQRGQKSKPVSHIIMCFPKSTQLSVVSRPPD
jgi:hypothetical protein